MRVSHQECDITRRFLAEGHIQRMRHQRKKLAFSQTYGILILVPGKLPSLLCKRRLDFRRACPGGITTVWLPAHAKKSELSVGLAPAVATTCGQRLRTPQPKSHCFRRVKPGGVPVPHAKDVAVQLSPRRDKPDGIAEMCITTRGVAPGYGENGPSAKRN